jgi:hypothetical protein
MYISIVGVGYRQGAQLVPEHADGKRTFDDFLAERFASGHS